MCALLLLSRLTPAVAPLSASCCRQGGLLHTVYSWLTHPFRPAEDGAQPQEGEQPGEEGDQGEEEQQVLSSQTTMQEGLRDVGFCWTCAEPTALNPDHSSRPKTTP